MKAPDSGDAPRETAAAACRCGRMIVIEPRWIGKPSACAGCEAHFVPEQVFDPRTKRWRLHLRYTKVFTTTDKVRGTPDGSLANVVCECGQKISFRTRHHGRNITCSACSREFAVRIMPAPRGGPPLAVTTHGSWGGFASAKEAPPVPDRLPATCPCGEAMNVPSVLFNRTQDCPECGAGLFFHLRFDDRQEAFALEARPC